MVSRVVISAPTPRFKGGSRPPIASWLAPNMGARHLRFPFPQRRPEGAPGTFEAPSPDEFTRVPPKRSPADSPRRSP
ncbi:MAG: hypothetical protein ACREA0_01520, partial [bacterium]